MQRYFTPVIAVALVLAACGSNDNTATTTAVPAPSSAPTTVSGGPADGALLAQEGDTVQVHYTGTLDDGSEFDSSRAREPLEFLVGSDQVIAGFDQAVKGLAIGDSVTVRIPAEDAYGELDPELVFSVPIDQAPDDVAEGDEVLIGGITPGVVTEVTATEVTIDTNHRFAGQALTFEIEVVSITR